MIYDNILYLYNEYLIWMDSYIITFGRVVIIMELIVSCLGLNCVYCSDFSYGMAKIINRLAKQYYTLPTYALSKIYSTGM